VAGVQRGRTGPAPGRLALAPDTLVVALVFGALLAVRYRRETMYGSENANGA